MFRWINSTFSTMMLHVRQLLLSDCVPGVLLSFILLHSNYRCFVEDHALLCRNGAWQTAAGFLKLWDMLLASQNLSIFCSPVLSFFSKQYYWPNFVERQRFCNHLVPLLNSTTSLAFNSAEVRVVNGLQPGKISSRVEQKHLPETVPSPD